MMETKARRLFYFVDGQGEAPFENWLSSIKNPTTLKRIQSRLLRLESGNFGDCKYLDQGVNELRLFFGPGYRVYFGEDENVLVVLLCGGDKSSQGKDIALAKQYWQEYLWQRKEQ